METPEPTSTDLNRPSPAYDDDLAEAINFSEEDLLANQRGLITDWQKRYKIRWRLRESYGVVGSALLMALFLLVVSGRLAVNASSPFLIYGPVFAVLAFVAYITYRGGGSIIPRVLRDLRGGKAASVSGTLQRETATVNNTILCYLKVDTLRLKVRKPVYDAMSDGAAYTLYYAPHTMTLLSAVRLES